MKITKQNTFRQRHRRALQCLFSSLTYTAFYGATFAGTSSQHTIKSLPDREPLVSMGQAKELTPLGYQGKPVSLDFQDIEVRRILQVLADYTGRNMLISDSVKGNISVHLKDIPWDQALDLILKSKGLAKHSDQDAIWIAPLAEMNQSEEAEAKILAQRANTAVLQTLFVPLKYAKARDIEQLIEKSKPNNATTTSTETAKKTIHSADPAGSLLSVRGRIVVDQRTNTLIITDTALRLAQIQQLIQKLDVAVKQVMIEARVVRASTDFTKELGVKWSIFAKGHDVRSAANNTALMNISDTSTEPINLKGSAARLSSANLNVDLGVTAAGASRIAFGLINLTDYLLDLELSALQADGAAEVISTPKVMTADKQKARVAAGRQVPYQTRENTNGVATTTTAFKDALLSLDVTPSITPDGRVQMQLEISSDSPGEIAPNGEFILNKNQINTNVLVNNGETIVLGGIFEQDSRNKKTKLPVLGDLPVIGRLFRRTEAVDKKSELLIFVTPRIVNDSLPRNH